MARLTLQHPIRAELAQPFAKARYDNCFVFMCKCYESPRLSHIQDCHRMYLMGGEL